MCYVTFRLVSVIHWTFDGCRPTVGCYVECVDAVILTQVISMAVAVLAIVWHQQRSTERLRTELRAEIAGLRTELKGDIADLRAELKGEIAELRADLVGVRSELKGEIGGLRGELKGEIGGLRGELAETNQRLARIEGYLGIGMPAEAAAAAAGARLVTAPAPPTAGATT